MNYADMSMEALWNEAYGLPDGKAKIEILEQAARLADAEGDIETGFEIRSEIVEIGSFHGFPMKALVAFSWQLGQYDKIRIYSMITPCYGPTNGYWIASQLFPILTALKLRICFRI